MLEVFLSLFNIELIDKVCTIYYNIRVGNMLPLSSVGESNRGLIIEEKT